MDEIVLLTSLALFLLLAAVCSIVFNKISLPPLVGYLIAGIIVNNFVDITETGEDVVEMLSNMGLIMLMFCLGLEINLKKIRKQGVFAMKVATILLPVMILGGVIAGGALGLNPLQCICLGAVLSGSSTAVVTAVLKTQKRADKDQFDTIILLMIMEDIGQITILSILTPMMAGNDLDAGELAAMILSIVVFMAACILVGLRFMPRVINWVSDNVTSEVVVIFSVGLAFGMALLSSYVGLSVAIGSFLMGMMIASSRKSKEIAHDIEPMKNIFMAMFFISVGMEIGLETLLDNIPMIIVLWGLFSTLMAFAVFMGYWLGNASARISFLTAISLLAMGEFAFIIAKQALTYNVIDEAFYTSIIGAALLSMIMLPILSRFAVPLWDTASERLPEPILKVFYGIADIKTSFYGRLISSSKRTMKEINYTLTSSYFCITLTIIIEIVFVLITPPLRAWGVTYFGGDNVFWSSIILLLNLFALYIPISVLISNLKIIDSKSERDIKRFGYSENKGNKDFLDRIIDTDTTLLSLMLGISILIIVPNDLGIWEHFVVLFIALVILLFVNKRSLTRKYEVKSYDDDNSFDIDTETFKELIRIKVLQNMAEEHTTSVSIDTGDFSKK